jgi:hypothetical protein
MYGNKGAKHNESQNTLSFVIAGTMLNLCGEKLKYPLRDIEGHVDKKNIA